MQKIQEKLNTYFNQPFFSKKWNSSTIGENGKISGLYYSKALQKDLIVFFNQPDIHTFFTRKELSEVVYYNFDSCSVNSQLLLLKNLNEHQDAILISFLKKLDSFDLLTIFKKLSVNEIKPEVIESYFERIRYFQERKNFNLSEQQECIELIKKHALNKDLYLSAFPTFTLKEKETFFETKTMPYSYFEFNITKLFFYNTEKTYEINDFFNLMTDFFEVVSAKRKMFKFDKLVSYPTLENNEEKIAIFVYGPNFNDALFKKIIDEKINEILNQKELRFAKKSLAIEPQMIEKFILEEKIEDNNLVSIGLKNKLKI